MPDYFGDRMKAYEAVSDIRLPARLPVLLRLDGNSFSKLTAGLNKPFDKRFTESMNEAAEAVLQYVHGCFAHVQSDEITILLRNDRSIDDRPLLGNRVQKLCSLAASTCSVKFFHSFMSKLPDGPLPCAFDCRAFVVPPSDVANAFLWRQADAWKNCVGAVAYYGLKAKCGKKEAQERLLNKSTKERQEIIFSELGINMNDYDEGYKRGRVIVKEAKELFLVDAIPAERLAELRRRGEDLPTTVLRHFYAVRPAPDFRKQPEFITDYLK
jgi:tRNA(His) guanylyltransferase